MDIAALSVVMSQANVKQQASMSMMNQVMDQSQSASNGLINMMEQSSVKAIEQSVSPHLGSSIDLKA